MILGLDKLGQQFNEFNSLIFMKFNTLWFLWRPTTGLVLYLKMLVLVTTIGVPKFMLVSKCAQFTKNFKLSCWTKLFFDVVVVVVVT